MGKYQVLPKHPLRSRSGVSVAAGGKRRGAPRGAAQVPHESRRCVVPAASTLQLVSAEPQLLLARRLRVELVCVCALCRRTPGVHTHIHWHRQSGAENAEWIVECHLIQHGGGGGALMGVTCSMGVEQHRGQRGREGLQ